MKFRDYWLSMKPGAEREDFARRCGTSVGYLNLVASGNATAGEGLAINIERESKVCRVEDIRPDVDWAVIRSGRRQSKRERAA